MLVVCASMLYKYSSLVFPSEVIIISAKEKRRDCITLTTSIRKILSSSPLRWTPKMYRLLESVLRVNKNDWRKGSSFQLVRGILCLPKQGIIICSQGFCSSKVLKVTICFEQCGSCWWNAILLNSTCIRVVNSGIWNAWWQNAVFLADVNSHNGLKIII